MKIFTEKKQNILNGINVIAFLAFLGFAYSAYLAIYFAHQPPLDVHSFRQTQTALSAYWFAHDGFSLAYATPVAGAPWSIPFEFPLYQFIVAAMSSMLGVSLDSTGRLVSFAFLVFCLAPVRSITKKLQFNDSVFYIFVGLVFSSPVYVYWGRSFMIETAALFFSIAAIKFFVDALIDGFGKKNIVLFVVFISISVLQKSTTALPVLAILSLVYLFSEVRKWCITREMAWQKVAGVAMLCFAIPLAVGVLWVYFTDQVKLQNSLGQHLTASATTRWNWGTLQQRISSGLFIDVLWVRIIATNLGGILGLFLIALPFLYGNSMRNKFSAFVSVALGIVPLFLFTNLHIVHDYYQSANIIFLIYAISISLGAVVLPTVGFPTVVAALLLVSASNYFALSAGYMPQIKKVFTKDSRDVALGEVLKRELPVNAQFVAFGNDWSSTFAYMAQRKSFTVPNWFKEFDAVKNNPERFVDKDRLGAIVSCSGQSLNASEIFKLSSARSWKVGETHGCLIATPQKSFNANRNSTVICQGGIDRAEVEKRDGFSMISVTGWTDLFVSKSDLPRNVFIVISGNDGSKRYIEALRVPRLDVNKKLGISGEEDAGFSLLTPATLPAGEYHVNVAQSAGDRLEICQFNKKLEI